MNDETLDVDAIVDSVSDAVAAGKYQDASAKEVLLIRLSALENIVKSYKEMVAKQNVTAV
ncbi:MAG: hypothetical protein LBQ61_04775 [Spirochaetales bacterium]|jgi:hypothetical protein|nr:hypothetical protein [Spirochaetales bacterium]